MSTSRSKSKQKSTKNSSSNSKSSKEEDRISKLPDAILQQILSSLELKLAVQTSILSHRWKNLWSSLPDLDFNYSRLAYQCGVNSDFKSFMPIFINFVTQCLSNRDHTFPIHRFKLHTNIMETDSTFVENCIDYALNHNVTHLDLDAFCYPTPYRFPISLFTSKTLRDLKLKQYYGSLLVPKPFVLHNLKTLYLERFDFNENGFGSENIYSFTKEPFSNFPNLEELTLHRCEVSGLTIAASKLRFLEISFRDPLFSSESRIEQISAPSLTCFRYEGYVSLVCTKMDLPSLEEVYVDVCANLESPYTDEIEKKMPLNLMKMMTQLGNAERVTLTLLTIEVLAMADPHVLEQSPSPFVNMKCLRFGKRPGLVHAMKNVPRNVMNYLTRGCSFGDDHSLVVKFEEGIGEDP